MCVWWGTRGLASLRHTCLSSKCPKWQRSTPQYIYTALLAVSPPSGRHTSINRLFHAAQKQASRPLPPTAVALTSGLVLSCLYKEWLDLLLFVLWQEFASPEEGGGPCIPKPLVTALSAPALPP